jgi:transposase
VVLGKSGRVLQRAKVNSNENEVLDFVRAVKGEKKLAFEEGVMSHWLYLLLKDEVNELVVCQPQDKPGPKNDEIDAGEIADLLRAGRLKSVFHVDSDLVHLRTLVSGYGDVIEEIVRTKNRYKALYRQVALPTDGSDFYKSTEMLDLLDTEERYYVACNMLTQLNLLDTQREGYVDLFESNARTCTPVNLLKSIPGIGPIRANQIVAVVVTPRRFPTKYQFFAYAMLATHKRESDGKLYGRKRAHGSPVLKEVFKSAALSAIKSNTAFRRKYDEMRSAGKDDKTARNAVARKIAATVLGVWKSETKYNDKQTEVTQRQSQECHSGT